MAREIGESEKAVKYTYDQANDRWRKERVLVVIEEPHFTEGSKVRIVVLALAVLASPVQPRC